MSKQMNTLPEQVNRCVPSTQKITKHSTYLKGGIGHLKKKSMALLMAHDFLLQEVEEGKNYGPGSPFLAASLLAMGSIYLADRSCI